MRIKKRLTNKHDKKKAFKEFRKKRGTYKPPDKTSKRRKDISYQTLEQFSNNEKQKKYVRKKDWFEEYATWLKTPYWKLVRKLVIERDMKMCTSCGSKNNLQAHHLTYKNHRNELNHLSDLVTLCTNCHKKEHKK